ncbi:MAG TPA: type II secretion system protein GspM [Rhizobacter sp.]|nr:type II secretion system protein GspM [Rhizobacter sp.]
MNTRWKRQTDRFMAMPRRQRALLLGVLCAGILVFGYVSMVEPLLKQRAQMTREMAQQNDTLRAMQAEIQTLNVKRQNPDAALRNELLAVRAQMRSADDQFKSMERSLVPAQDIGSWLASLLQAQRGLQLTGLRSLQVTSVTELVAAKAAAAAPSAAASASALTTLSAPAAALGSTVAPSKETPDAWLYRHGVEITLQGSYTDLSDYLHALEHLPRRVYWGELKLNAQKHPVVVMTLTVYTISLEKTWWVI